MLALSALSTLLAASASLPFSLAHDLHARSVLDDLEGKLEALFKPLLYDFKNDVIPVLGCGACLGLVTAMKVGSQLTTPCEMYSHTDTPRRLLNSVMLHSSIPWGLCALRRAYKTRTYAPGSFLSKSQPSHKYCGTSTQLATPVRHSATQSRALATPALKTPRHLSHRLHRTLPNPSEAMTTNL